MADKATLQAVKKALEKSKKRNFVEAVDISINLKDIDLSVPKNRIVDDVICLTDGAGRSRSVSSAAANSSRNRRPLPTGS